MTFKHINFSDSPVMRELERIAKAKGEFNSTSVESVVKKVAASKPKKKVTYEPGQDLMQDILKLADGLRAKGFEKQADSLETKFLNYKKAETHLYRAIDEDGEDVVGFAHPHAATPISDSEHAKVPNILEKHKKIVDVVNKQPTGKYAEDVADIVKDAEEILGLKKKAIDPAFMAGSALSQIPMSVAPAVAVTGAVGIATTLTLAAVSGALSGYLANKLFSHIYDKKELIAAGDNLKSELDDLEVSSQEESGSITAQQKTVIDSFKNQFDKFKELYSKKDMNNLSQIVSGLNDLRKLAARISSIVGDKGSTGGGLGINPLNWGEYFTGADEFRDVFLAAQNFIKVADIEMVSQQNVLQSTLEELKKEKPEEYSKLIAQPIIDEFAKKVPGVAQEKIHPDIAASITKQLNDLAAYALKIGNNKLYTAFKNYASIFGNPKVLEVPYAQILWNLQRMGLKNIEQFKAPQDFKTKYIDPWIKYFSSQKTSSSKIVRNAQDAEQLMSVAPTASVAPAAPELDASGLPPTPTAAGPHAATTSARPSAAAQEPEKGAVQRLQMILNNLGMQLASDPKNKNLANILIATGPKGAETIDQFDGKWGSNTDKAVQAAAKLGIKVNPGATYSQKPKSKEEVDAAAKKAEQNTSVIVQYMNSKGMGEKIPAALKKKRTYKTLDSIKQGSTADDAWATEDEYEGPGAISITTADFISFSDLDKLIKRSGLTGEGFQEVAVQAPQATPVPQQAGKQTPEQTVLQRGVPAAKVNLGSFIQSVKLLKSAQAAQAAKTGRTKSGWKEILQRFYVRASSQYQRAASAEEADENVKQVKTLYLQVIRGLFNKFERGTANLPDDQAVSAYDLDYKLQQQGAGQGGAASTGQPMPGQKGQGVNEGSEFEVQKRKIMENPLGDIVNLWALYQTYPSGTLANWGKYFSLLRSLTYLDISSLNSAPIECADQLLKALTMEDVKAQFRNSRLVQNLKPGTAFYTMYTGMAKLQRLLFVLNNLRVDLGSIVSATDQAIRNNEVSPQAMQVVNRGWANWNSRLDQMIQRINDQYQSLSTGVSDASRNEPV